MAERKVLNKYYPPDFDPSKIPKLRLARNRQYSIRIMAPFNMRCETCGEYIYKGKKFNSRKETVENENYLGLHIFRFYIKCPRCVAEIAFKTDPEKTDYELEAGATRNFEAARTAEELAKKELQEKEEAEKNNPMKMLENRTKASRQEMEMIETLEELRDLNSRHAKVDHGEMLKLHKAYEEQLAKLQDEEDENFIKSAFGHTSEGTIKRLHDSDDDDVGEETPRVKIQKSMNPTDILTQESQEKNSDKEIPSWEKSIGSLSSNKTKLGMMIKKKPAVSSSMKSDPDTSISSSNNTASGKGVKKPTSWEKSVGSLSTNKTKLSMLVKKKVSPAVTTKDVDDKESDMKKESNDSSIKDTTKFVSVTTVNKQETNALSLHSKNTSPAVPSGLSLLGNYSDSDSDNASD